MEPAQLAADTAQDLPPVASAAAEPMAPVPEPQAAQADTSFAAAPAPAPLIRASSDPMRAAVMQRLAQPVPAPTSTSAENAFARPSRSAVRKSKAADGALHGGSDWVVQIGAFSNGQMAASAWSRVKGKAFEDRGYRRITGTVTLNGHTYHRLAMSGFDSRATAMTLCASLRSQGQTCFVRRDEGVANDIRMARAGKGTKAAALPRPRTIASR